MTKYCCFKDPKTSKILGSFFYHNSSCDGSLVVVNVSKIPNGSEISDIMAMGTNNTLGIIGYSYDYAKDWYEVIISYDYYMKNFSTSTSDVVTNLPVGINMSKSDDLEELKPKDPITNVKPRTQKDDLKDFFFGKKDYLSKCTCGLGKSPGLHSDWCGEHDQN